MDVRCGQTGRWLADLCVEILSIMLLIQTAFVKQSLTGNNIATETLKSVCH